MVVFIEPGEITNNSCFQTIDYSLFVMFIAILKNNWILVKIIDSIFPNHEVAVKGKKLTDSFWAPKNFSGYILYSLWEFPSKWDALTAKWVTFLIRYRLKTSLLKEKLLEPSKGMPMDCKHKAGWLAMNDDPVRILQRTDESDGSDNDE